jgi:hypothetical protein
MNKTYLGVGILILVIVGGLCFLVVDEPVVEPVPVEPVETATSTPATATTEAAMSTTSTSTTPDETELDLTKLQGKDRLYTEEEGKYENLSAEEQKLVTAIRLRQEPGCLQDDYCAVARMYDSIISLKGNYVLMQMSAPKPGQSISLVDITNLETIEGVYSWWRPITSENIYFRIVNNTDGTERLAYYRPGWSEFVDVPDSTLEEGITYAIPGMVSRTEYTATDNKLSITTFLYDLDIHSDENGDILPEARVGVKEFDLSNLP